MIAAGLAAFLWPSGAAALPATPDAASSWVTNGRVNAIAHLPGRVIIGGDFSYVGQFTGHASLLDPSNGSVVTGSGVQAARVLGGTVSASIGDGQGGYFIGGNFTQVSDSAGVAQTRVGLAHLLASGTLDAAWGADITPDSFGAGVLALALSKGTLYVGGGFTALNGRTRQGLAAVAATDGALKDWAPQLSTTTGRPTTHALTVASDSKLFGARDMVYAGGSFCTPSGGPCGLARFDPTTGAPDTSWQPSVAGDVYALAVLGNNLYLGGSFSSIGAAGSPLAVPRRDLAAVALSNGAPTAWDPEPGGKDAVNFSYVTTIVPAGSGALYVGGQFYYFGTGSVTPGRQAIAKLDASSGQPTAWARAGSSFGVVWALARSADGATVYAAGRRYQAPYAPLNTALPDADTGGSAPNWSPPVDADSKTLALSGATILAGGTQTSVNGQPRAALAALIAGTGTLDPAFDAQLSKNVNGTTPRVDALALDPSGATLYVAGNFDHVGTQPHGDLARIDPSSGSADASWNPDLYAGSNVYEGEGLALAVGAAEVYVGGDFSTVRGLVRNNIAAIQIAGDGTPDPRFDPGAGTNEGADDVVRAVALDPGRAALYVGGSFGHVAGQVRGGLAALDPATGVPANTFTGGMGGSSPEVDAILPTTDAVYVGGSFSSAAGATRANLAALAPASGAALPFSADATGSRGQVASLALTPGPTSRLLVGGSFNSFAGFSRVNLAAISPVTGSSAGGVVDAWDPRPDEPRQQQVTKAILPVGERILLGGSFTTIAGAERGGYISFGLQTPANPSPPPSVDGLPHAGQVLTCLTGGWPDDPIRYEFQWWRDGAPIPGATSSTRGVDPSADVGHDLSCAVSAANAAGTSNPVRSAAVHASAAVAPANTAAPTISGTARPGHTLTCTAGSWTGDPTISYTYAWSRDGQPVAGGADYPVGQPDDGHRLSCTVTAHNYGGAVAAGSAPVAIGTAPAVQTPPEISGPAVPGGVLVCSQGLWGGSQPQTYAYQWLEDGLPEPGESHASHTLSADESGHAIACQVTATNVVASTAAVSAAVTPRTPLAPSSVAPPQITGNSTTGNPLSCSTGVWGGDEPQSYGYQWLRERHPIAGATSSGYTTGQADDGHQLVCRVTATNAVGSVNQTSAPIAIGSPPSNTSPPQIGGSPILGQTLSCSPGSWAGTVPQSYAYQWYRDAVALPGEVAPTHRIVADDVGRAMVCAVTATNVVGSASANSPPVTPDLPPPEEGVNANYRPVAGQVLYTLPGASAPLRMSNPRQLPLGSTIDTTNGHVVLTSATSTTPGPTQSASFYDGPFRASQRRGDALTTLTFAASPNCRAAAKAAAAARRRRHHAADRSPRGRRVVKLWGDGHGRFSVHGEFASSTVRGTHWLTEDTCAGTKVRVARGVVAVRDFALRKTVLVPAGQSYLAHRP